MQDKKKMVRSALAKVVKKLRGNKSQFVVASEIGLSTSIISPIERGLKDPQLTTLFRLADAFKIDIVEFVKLLKDELPKDFSLIED